MKLSMFKQLCNELEAFIDYLQTTDNEIYSNIFDQSLFFCFYNHLEVENEYLNFKTYVQNDDQLENYQDWKNRILATIESEKKYYI